MSVPVIMPYAPPWADGPVCCSASTPRGWGALGLLAVGSVAGAVEADDSTVLAIPAVVFLLMVTSAAVFGDPDEDTEDRPPDSPNRE